MSLCLVNVGLLDHFLHVALNLCTRLQLCSTAQSSRSDSSLAGSSTRSVPAVPRQSSETAGRSSHPVGGHLLRHHVCLRTGVLECLDDASLHLDFTFVSLVSGHPRPPVVTAPVYCECPCQDPLGCLRCPSRMASEAERQPLWLRCVGGGGHVMWTFLIHAFYQHFHSSPLSQQYRSSRINEVSKFDDSMINLHKKLQIPKNCQCK